MKQKIQIRFRHRRGILSGFMSRCLLLICVQLAFATSIYAQERTVTLNYTDTPLSVVFTAIQQQSGVKIFFNNEQVDVDQKVSVNLRNATVNGALNSILGRLNMKYEFVNGIYVISNTEAGVNVSFEKFYTITGVVLDAQRKPILGATVILRNHKGIGTATDSEGRFRFRSPVQSGQLEISYIGKKNLTVSFDGTGELRITMEDDLISIDELIITGYAPKAKNSFIGTAVQVTGEELITVNPTRLFDAMKVFDPSFSVVDSEGVYGSNPNYIPERIDIRGQNSMPDISEGTLKTYTSLPIFILDGFEISVQQVYDLDMNRINTLTILKDAAAAAIYGSRAANGVVVIETKTPESGKLRVTYNLNMGVEAPDLSSYNLMNSAELLEYYRRSQLFNNGDKGDGTTTNIYENLLGGNPGRQNLFMLLTQEVANGVDSYWLSQPVRTGFKHDHSLMLEGGTALSPAGARKDLRYMVNLRAAPSQGAMKGSDRNRYEAGLKLFYDTNKLRVTSDIQFSQVDYTNSPYGSYSTYAGLLPFYRMKDANGDYYRTLSYQNIPIYEGFPKPDFTGNTFQNQRNPLYEATQLSSYDKGDDTSITYNLGLNWNPVSTLRIQANFSLNNVNSKHEIYKSPLSPDYYDVGSVGGSSSQGYNIDNLYRRGSYSMSNSNRFMYTGKFVVSYIETFGRHTLQGVLGGEIKQTESESDSYGVIGFMDDPMGYPSYGIQFTPNSGPGGDKSIVRTAGTFLNMNYDYDSRYLFDLTGRIDGSSLYASKERTAPFWSVGARWNMHNESFLSGSKFINELALRANIGTTGNENFTLSEMMTLYRFADSYNGVVGASIMALANDALKWQTTLERNLGLTVALFDRKLLFEGNIYKKTTKDNLTDISLPLSSGFATFKANQGDVENKGYEFKLTYTPINNRNMMLSFFVNGTHNSNKLTKLSDSLKEYNESVKSAQSSTSSVTSSQVERVFLFEEGTSLNAIWAVRSLGIDPATGKEVFLTRDGEKTFTWNANDQVVVGTMDPDLRGYFGMNVRYKQFYLSTSFEYSFGADRYNTTLYKRMEGGKFDTNMDRRALKDRWYAPGDVAKYRSLTNLSLRNTSSRFVQKENYVAFTAISLSYDLNSRAIEKLGLSMLRLKFTTNDLFYGSTIRRERGLDYPYARQYTFSLMANF